MTGFLADADHIKLHERTLILSPRLWSEYPNSPTLVWHRVLLDKSEASLVPTCPGIYTFLLQPEIAGHPAISYLMYVGKASSLKRRFGEYLRSRIKDDRRPAIHNFLNKYLRVWFYFAEVPYPVLTLTEDNLIKALLPPLNREIPAEVSKPVRANF